MSSSPRSSALSRASSQRSRKSGYSSLTARLEDNIMPVLLLAAIVASAVIAWIVGNRYEPKALADGWNEVFRNAPLAGVALLTVLGVTAWVTAHSFMRGDDTARMALLVIFVLVALLLAVAMWFFYRRDDRTVAFYLVVATTVAGLVHTYFCWRSWGVMGVVGMVPAVLLLVFLLWHFWPEGNDEAAAATTTA